MTRKLAVEVDPAEAGFDPGRLGRLDGYFGRYVDKGLLPGTLAVVARRGKVVYLGEHGFRDVEAGLPVERDTLWRVFSMSKPVTSVAAMMLYEEGVFDLTDPISRWLPEFAEPRVYARGSAQAMATVPATEPIRVWHLLTHTAGLTYGFQHAHAVDELYRKAGYEWWVPRGTDLASAVEQWAALPLLFHPGTEWNYSVATDVLGRLVEVASGQPLDEFFRTRILDPLGMTETGFEAEGDSLDRLAALYLAVPGSDAIVRNDLLAYPVDGRPTYLSGGGGLVSTAADYHRFTQFLLREGELDGVRLLGPRTVALMRGNHLPGHVDLEQFGRPLFAEMPYDGYGFGLGFSVLEDPVKAKTLAPQGEIAWGGAASTAFWVDPANEITALFFTQLLPSSTHPLRQDFRRFVYQALLD
ncbi:serine hydrolase domain-containing protein [Amycolatopsis minnesotensis]|uniref:Serine hydrolase domain-containing protein n=1 Tax=Amycolatopsis minnesotensis TaxID=337894 RepID=A0ABN2QFA6_9PSEU